MPGPIRTLPTAEDLGGVRTRRSGRAPGPGAVVAARKKVQIPTSHVDRLLMAAWRALPMMPEEIRAQVAALLTRKAMLTIAGIAVIWAGSQFFGIGEVFDVFAVGLTWVMVGSDAIKGLQGYVKYYQTAIHANSDADITRAARLFADSTISIISAIGWGRFAKWMGKGVMRAGEAVGAGEAAAAQIARWQKFIEAIEFKVPRDKGMLWSSMEAADGAKAAENLARQKGLVTLEMSLKKTGFQELMNNEYGEYATMSQATKAITKEIWLMVSKRYAQSLEGRVTGYAHRATHYLKINQAAKARIIGEPVSVSLRDAEKMINPNDPVLVTEVKEISDMLMNNPKVTDLTLIDIKTGEAFGYRSREVLESLQRLEAKPTFLPHLP